MTSREATEHVDAGCVCPKCADSHYQVDQLVVSTQDAAHAIWDSSEYYEDDPYVIKVECKACGHVLYDQTSVVDIALRLILDENQEIKS